MSRSRRKTPITGVAVGSHGSDKWDKQKTNRKLRHRVKEAVLAGAELLPERREVSDVWSFFKDGKSWRGFRPENEKMWRK